MAKNVSLYDKKFSAIKPVKMSATPKPQAPINAPVGQQARAPDLSQERQKFFASQRGEMERQQRGQQQEAADVINRRMASIGQSGSGAAMNMQLKARETLGAQGSAALNDLRGQELQANMTADEAEAQRGFQREQSGIDRGFQRELANNDMSFKKEAFGLEQGNKLAELDIARRQFELDKDTTKFNRRIAELEMQPARRSLFGTGIGSLGMENSIRDFGGDRLTDSTYYSGDDK
jgi:hypothetical protein